MTGRGESMQRTRRAAPGGRRWCCWLLLAGLGLLQGCQFLQNEVFSLDRAAPGVAAQRQALREASRW